MSDTTKAPFASVDYGDAPRPDNDALRSFADAQGVPRYAAPDQTSAPPRHEPEVTARDERAPESVAVDPSDQEDGRGEGEETDGRPKRRSGRMTKENADHTPVNLGIKVPAYVRQQIRQRAARDGVTATHLILTALRDTHGLTIYADDLAEDRRIAANKRNK